MTLRFIIQEMAILNSWKTKKQGRLMEIIDSGADEYQAYDSHIATCKRVSEILKNEQNEDK